MWKTFLLVVNDDVELLESVNGRLGNRGFMVDTARDGAEVLKKIGANLYDGADALQALEMDVSK